MLFLLPREDDAPQAELRDALLAQFALIQANLVFAPEPEGETSLATRMQRAQALAAQHAAIAVFWIDTEPDGRWFLHMMDVQDERVVVRQIDASGERRTAAIEAIAVMTRGSNARADRGHPGVAGARARTAAPARARAGRGPRHSTRFALWLGYTGTSFAPEVPWQHGATLGASWLGPRPFYAGLSFTIAPTVELSGNGLAAPFSVQRTPIAAHFGYRHVAGRVALDGELGVIYERWYRSRGRARSASPWGTGRPGFSEGEHALDLGARPSSAL